MDQRRTAGANRCRRNLLLALPVALAPISIMTRTSRGNTTETFAARAMAMRDLARAGGDQPYGAVIVKADRILVEAPSRVVLDGDPTAHAEMEAIRRAARQLGSRELSGCVMYSSSRPCPMCEAAAYWAGVERMYHGAAATDAGAPRLC